jgi:guanosine-3',5'-bis(diphosphate) 3'-pyrophosphohydrolase
MFVFQLLTAATLAAAGLGADAAISSTPTEQVDEKSIVQKTRVRLAEMTHNNDTVMTNYDHLAEVLDIAYHKEKSLTLEQVEQICTGVDFAAEKHRFQTRKNKDKTPYISHPIGVAYNVMSVGEVRDVDVIIGALLHDTVEDTQTTFEEIENKFGKRTASLVREVTDDRSLAMETRKRMQVISASQKSIGAAQIKLADKLFNLNDLMNNTPEDWTQARIDGYYEWAQAIVDRLPKANEKLHEAVEDIINTYWENQATKK